MKLRITQAMCIAGVGALRPGDEVELSESLGQSLLDGNLATATAPTKPLDAIIAPLATEPAVIDPAAESPATTKGSTTDEQVAPVEPSKLAEASKKKPRTK